MNTAAGARIRLYDAAHLQGVLDRMAQQLLRFLDDDQRVVMVGVLRRGAPLADLLAQRLVSQHATPPPTRLDLRVKRYADDLTLLYPDTKLEDNADPAAVPLENRHVVVVDDVLFKGYSLLRVTQWLERQRPHSIRTAVLADRCVSVLPVHADVVGVRLEVAATDIVECHVPPYETDLGIDLVQKAR